MKKLIIISAILFSLSFIRNVSGTFCQAQIITTIAGTGASGYTGNGGAATSASFFNPAALTCDASGDIYIGDLSNSCIRKITMSTGIITTPPGTTGISFPTGIAVDAAKNIYVAEWNANRIRKISSAGVSTIIAGTGVGGYSGDGGLAINAQLYMPYDVELDATGAILYIADAINYRVRKINLSTGIISTFAGTGSYGFNGNGIQATVAMLASPSALAIDGSNNLFILDKDNARIRKVTAATGIISTLMGTGVSGATGDGGPATAATMSYQCYGLTLDASGNIYFSDMDNQRIRKINKTSGIITKIVGSGVAGFSGDGGSPILANLNGPRGLAVDATGNLFFADQQNNRIRKIAGIPLPVELVSFSGKNAGEINILSWTTASETNNNYFEIERSIDGINFQPIGTASGHGNSSDVINYSFEDKNILETISYYRLKQVDFNGANHYTHIIAVNNVQTGQICIVFPDANPGVFILKCQNVEVTQLQILTIEGKTIRSISSIHDSETKIDLREFNKGMYILRVNNGRHVQNFKLMKA